MTFQELSTGDYFRIPGMSTGYIYRKASDSHCSLHGMLQPIRAYTRVKRLTSAEVYEYFAIQQAYREKLKKPA